MHVDGEVSKYPYDSDECNTVHRKSVVIHIIIYIRKNPERVHPVAE